MGRTITHVLSLAALTTGWACGSAMAQEVDPADNPLIGNWVNTAGIHGCKTTLTFAAHSQRWVFGGIATDAPATYARSGNTIYVQWHPGHGGIKAYIVVGPDEIMDTIGRDACHWKRQ